MIKIIKLLFLIVITSLYSCKENDKIYSNKEIKFYSINDFENIDSLYSQKMNNISDSLVTPVEIEVVGNYLVLLDRKSKRPLHLINHREEKYLGAYGIKGQGPGELAIPWKISDYKDSLLVYDAAGKKILGFNIDSLMKGRKPFFEKKVNEKGICSAIQFIDDNLYYTDEIESEKRLLKLNMVNNKISGYGSLLNNHQNIEGYNWGQVCRGTMDYKKNTFAITYLLAPFFEIYNKDDNTWTSIMAIDNFPPIFIEEKMGKYKKFVTTKNTKLGFLDVSMSDNYIYFLYSGQKMEHNNKADEGSIVLVFDYKGNPKKYYNLNEPISELQILNDTIIYGLKNDIRVELLKFKL